MASWTMEDLEVLEKAIATGTLRVRYADKEVQYRTLDEMIRIRDIIKKELGLTPKNAGRKFGEFNSGLQ